MEGKNGVLQSFQKFSKAILKAPQIVIDNIVFRLYYRYTVIFLLGSTVLITLQQYFGEHIRCIADSGVSIKVINTFCFFSTTFTVVRHFEESALEDEIIPHPGIGPFIKNQDFIIQHAYYQWVPFVIFLQAIMFYIPHFIWKHLEGERLKALVVGLEFAALTSSDADIRLKESIVPSRESLQKSIKKVQKAFLERLHINRSWAISLVSCEILNVLNLCIQFVITDTFLGGAFWHLGPNVVSSDMSKEMDPLEVIFPKVTKCTFYKYGPSGSIQNHDALCVMSLNVINEKIYTFLWFWLAILAVATVLGLIWRLLTLLLHSRSHKFNAIVFSVSCPQPPDPWDLVKVTDECHFSDWLFLRYLAKNLDGHVFRELFVGLARYISEDANPERYRFYNDEPRPLNGE